MIVSISFAILYFKTKNNMKKLEKKKYIVNLLAFIYVGLWLVGMILAFSGVIYNLIYIFYRYSF